MFGFRRIRRILSFYFLLLLMNYALFFYEVFVVKMLVEQSLIFRAVTLVTDLFESIIFLEYLKNLATYILKFLHINIRPKWLLGGIKLALIGPNVYLIKLFFVNFILYSFDCGIPPLVIDKIILAYAISLLFSFTLGSLWVLYLEKSLNRLMKLIRTYGP